MYATEQSVNTLRAGEPAVRERQIPAQLAILEVGLANLDGIVSELERRLAPYCFSEVLQKGNGDSPEPSLCPAGEQIRQHYHYVTRLSSRLSTLLTTMEL